MKKLAALLLCIFISLSIVSCNKQAEIKDFGDTTPITMEEIENIKAYKELRVPFFFQLNNMASETISLTHTIIYGEVIGRGESEIIDYYGDNMNIYNHCVTDVYIKTEEIIKGKAGNIYTYKEIGGIKDDIAYISPTYSLLQPGDKVLLFLSENGALIGMEGKGLHKEGADGKFPVDVSLLKEGMYTEGKNGITRIEKDVYINYLKEIVKSAENRYTDTINKKVIIADGDAMSPVYNIDTIAYCCSDVIYGEVLEKGELKYFETTTVKDGKLLIEPYCYREVKVNVISRALGDESKETVTYLEVGGRMNGFECEALNMPTLNVGDKAVLCLTENGAIAFAEGYGFFKADKSENIEVCNFIEGDGLEGKMPAQSYISFIKEELVKYEKAEKEKYAKGKMIQGTVCVLTDPDYDYYDMAKSTELVVYGTLRFGKNNVLMYDTSAYLRADDCYTQVFMDVEECIYNESGDTDLKEIMYLKHGGETDTTIYNDGFGPIVSDGEKVLLYLYRRGSVYFCSAAIRTDAEGNLLVRKDEFPEKYSDGYKRIMTAKEYKDAVTPYLESIE